MEGNQRNQSKPGENKQNSGQVVTRVQAGTEDHGAMTRQRYPL